MKEGEHKSANSRLKGREKLHVKPFSEVTKRLGLNIITTHIKERYLCEVMEVLTNLIVVIISQYTCVSDDHIVYLKFTQC